MGSVDRLAVDYTLLCNDGVGVGFDLAFEHFNARSALNDYEVRTVHACITDCYSSVRPRTSFILFLYPFE